MIISPLEQFNILSLSDFSLSGGFEIFYSSFLFWIWSLFYNLPIFLINFLLNNITTVFAQYTGIFSNFISFLTDFYQLLITNFFYLFAHFVSFFLIIFKIESIYFINAFFYNIYNSCLSYIWVICYQNLNIFYSADHISLITIPFSILGDSTVLTSGANLNLDNSISTSSSLSPVAASNIALICNSLGLFLINCYFFFFEFYLTIKTFIYAVLIENLLKLSLCNFSYLIFSLNTSTFFQLLGITLISLLFLTITWKNSITLVATNRWQTVLEMFYQVILNVVNDNAGPKGKKFFPLIFTTFVIILTCNVLGMIPYSFTVTSHLIITFSTALAIFTGMNILGILKHGKHFLSLFFPPGAPLALAPLLVFIEFISYIFRVLSLSIRLFANLMSGHTLLKILATFSWGVVSLWGFFLLPITIILIVTGLEMAIAFLQAYIFSVLLCIYLNDAFNLH